MILVMFQEAPSDSKPWMVGRFISAPLYEGASKRAHSNGIVDLQWFNDEMEARGYAHSLEHGSNR